MSQRRRVAILEPGKSWYVSKNRGLALLDEAIAQITLQAKSPSGQWHQGQYRCGSGMCLAGWVGQLAGGEWVAPADEQYYGGHMAAEPGDEPGYVETYHGLSVIHVSDRATRLLEPIDEEDCDSLFDGFNDLEEIENIRNRIAKQLGDA